MFAKFLQLYLRQQFHINLLSVFINPFFFIRRGLYRGIKRHADKLQGRLLDFGCGRKPYRDLFQVEEYIGVDIEVSGHSHENEQIDVYYDGKTIPFPNAYFDSLFCSEVFEHVFNLDEIVPEVNRVLKPGALALITVPFVWDEHEVPYDFGRYSAFGIRHVLEKHGFEVLEHEKSTHFIEVLFQLWNLYIHNLVRTRNKFLNIPLFFIFISPFTIIGIIFTTILPRQRSLYHNNVVLARKVR
jgi:SAM-dependent methyltransferase